MLKRVEIFNFYNFYQQFVAINNTCTKFNFCRPRLNILWLMTVYIQIHTDRHIEEVFTLEKSSYCKICFLRPKEQIRKRGPESSGNPMYTSSALYPDPSSNKSCPLFSNQCICTRINIQYCQLVIIFHFLIMVSKSTKKLSARRAKMVKNGIIWPA